MDAPDNQPLSEYMATIVAKAKQWQVEHPDNPMVNAVLDHLMGRVDEAYAAQRFQAVSGYLRNIQDVMSEPEPREHVSGRVQIVTVPTWEEAKELCPWACRFQPVGNLPHQEGKWICFESHDDADVYRNLRGE